MPAAVCSSHSHPLLGCSWTAKRVPAVHQERWYDRKHTGWKQGDLPAAHIYSQLPFHFIFYWQIRKLEFLMADALHKGCDNIITCGGIQSNHSRATAVAAAQLGLKPHLVLRTTVPTVGYVYWSALALFPDLPTSFNVSREKLWNIEKHGKVWERGYIATPVSSLL